MDKKILLSCESTVDLSYDYLNKRNISVLFYSYIIDGIEKEDNMQRDESETKNFFLAQSQGKRSVTSQLTYQKYYDYFSSLQEKGNDVILHLSFSSGLTPSVENGERCANDLNKLSENKKIIVIDTTCGSSGYGLLVSSVKDMIDNGDSLENILQWIEFNKRNVQHLFFLTNITMLKKSGRIKGAVALVSKILNICPVLRVNYEGKIVVSGNARGKKNAIKSLATSFNELLNVDDKYKNKVIISHSNCLDLAQETKNAIQMATSNNNVEIIVSEVGTVMSSHCGEGAVALFFYGSEREE